MLLQDFYSVLKTFQEDGKTITHLRINKNHELYNGHFPSRPVTPGVILMHMFREEMERLTGKRLKLSKASNVKFMAVVDPNIDDVLVLESEMEDNKETVELRGMAKNNGNISLKINASFK
ncbi:hydroxymyristoyl-ACP dehydratase [Zunongwangia sp. H14]|uniref:hydroxymyristoyl-ACP dehydratase n=1 Tax=Zunongwangia sp. H14 TaxID=3240792 RepID=UPI003566125D